MAGSFASASSEYIDLDSSSASLDTANGWLSMWFKASTSQSNIVLEMGYDGNNFIRIAVGPSTSSWTDESIIYERYVSSAYSVRCAVANGHDFYLDGAWHNMIIQMNGDNKCFVDGVEQTLEYSGDSSGGPWGDAATANSFLSTGGTNKFRLGYAFTYGAGLNGQMFDVRIYDNTMPATASIAKIIYESRGNDGLTTGLKGRWLMNEQTTGATMTSAIGVSPNGFDGTPTNTPTVVEGPFKLVR